MELHGHAWSCLHCIHCLLLHHAHAALQVQPHLPTQALLMGAEAASHVADAALTLTAPGMQPLVVPLQPPHHAAVRCVELTKYWKLN